MRASGPSPEQALPFIERIPEGSEVYVAACQLKARVLRALGLPATALRVVESAIAQNGATPQLLRQLAELQNDTGAQDQSIESQRKLLAQRYDDFGARRVLIADALQRGQSAEVLEHIEAMNKLAPGVTDLLLAIASLYDALGRDDMVLSTYRKALEVAPESADVYVAYGRALLRTERTDLAREALARALALGRKTRRRASYSSRSRPGRATTRRTRWRRRRSWRRAATATAIRAPCSRT